MQIISAELRTTPDDAEESKEEAEWLEIVESKKRRKDAAVAAQSAQAEAVRRMESEEGHKRRQEKRKNIFTHLQRRAHFKIRIRELEEKKLRLTKESYFIDANRSELSMLMRKLQLRLVLLNQERDRIRGFKGTMVNSSVLHGAEMKYEINAFKLDLDKARDSCARCDMHF